MELCCWKVHHGSDGGCCFLLKCGKIMMLWWACLPGKKWNVRKKKKNGTKSIPKCLPNSKPCVTYICTLSLVLWVIKIQILNLGNSHEIPLACWQTHTWSLAHSWFVYEIRPTGVAYRPHYANLSPSAWLWMRLTASAAAQHSSVEVYAFKLHCSSGGFTFEKQVGKKNATCALESLLLS